MIGFSIHAYGAGNFVADVAKWTEARLWFARVGFAGRREPVTPGAGKGAVKAIEKGFKTLAQSRTYKTCALGWDCLVTAVGDVAFAFQFDGNCDPQAQYLRYSSMLMRHALGDQVVLAMSDIIDAYHLHVLSAGYNGPYRLQMIVNL